MDKRIPEDFLKKFAQNQHTEQEHGHFREWLREAPADQVEEILETYSQFFKSLPEDETLKYPELIKQIELKLDSIDNEEEAPRKLWPQLKSLASLAAMILLTVAGYYWYTNNSANHTQTANRSKIVPGSNKAVLTLDNGTKVVLDDEENGIIAHQGNVVIEKSKEGQLLYSTVKNINGNNAAKYNTVATPNGGQYQVILPDGTKVWLNAASSLRFPASFRGKERRVALSGEAYFEVAKNKAMPFVVVADHTQVQVIGTHFNVTAYKDEVSQGTTTTLLEGSVKIIQGNQSRMIVPGEQAKADQNIRVSEVNALEAIEWKNGNFNFSHENFESIMKKIARWYDVEIEYQGSVTQEGFVGTMPRSKNISEVLKRLELTGLVHFKVVERRVIVMP